MKTLNSLAIAGLLILRFLLSVSAVQAATVQTTGAGSAVAQVDRLATFDILDSTHVVDLGNYSENGLFITTGMTSWADDVNMAAKLDPFYGATAPDRAFFCVSWDNPEWTSIRTTNHVIIYGAEFVYGNGWSTGDPYGPYPWGNNNAILIWQTWRAGTNVSSGTLGDVSVLPVGTVIGFYDPAGFDQLLMKSIMTSAQNTNSNALALDNLKVMLVNIPPAPVVSASDLTVDPVRRTATVTLWETIAGCQYRLVYTDNLSSSSWSPVPQSTADGWVAGGGVLAISDPVAPSVRFYRVQVK